MLFIRGFFFIWLIIVKIEASDQIFNEANAGNCACERVLGNADLVKYIGLYLKYPEVSLGRLNREFKRLDLDQKEIIRLRLGIVRSPSDPQEDEIWLDNLRTDDLEGLAQDILMRMKMIQGYSESIKIGSWKYALLNDLDDLKFCLQTKQMKRALGIYEKSPENIEIEDLIGLMRVAWTLNSDAFDVILSSSSEEDAARIREHFYSTGAASLTSSIYDPFDLEAFKKSFLLSDAKGNLPLYTKNRELMVKMGLSVYFEDLNELRNGAFERVPFERLMSHPERRMVAICAYLRGHVHLFNTLMHLASLQIDSEMIGILVKRRESISSVSVGLLDDFRLKELLVETDKKGFLGDASIYEYFRAERRRLSMLKLLSRNSKEFGVRLDGIIRNEVVLKMSEVFWYLESRQVGEAFEDFYGVFLSKYSQLKPFINCDKFSIKFVKYLRVSDEFEELLSGLDQFLDSAAEIYGALRFNDDKRNFMMTRREKIYKKLRIEKWRFFFLIRNVNEMKILTSFYSGTFDVLGEMEDVLRRRINGKFLRTSMGPSIRYVFLRFPLRSFEIFPIEILNQLLEENYNLVVEYFKRIARQTQLRLQLEFESFEGRRELSRLRDIEITILIDAIDGGEGEACLSVTTMLTHQKLNLLFLANNFHFPLFIRDNLPGILKIDESYNINGFIPIKITCNHCDKLVKSMVKRSLGRKSFCMAGMLSPSLLCWLPLYVDVWRDVGHYCPECDRLLAVF